MSARCGYTVTVREDSGCYLRTMGELGIVKSERRAAANGHRLSDHRDNAYEHVAMADTAISTPGIRLQGGEASITTHAQLAHILRDVAAEFGATVEQLRGPQRRFVPARKEFCRRAWNVGHWSSTQIGRALNRDRTVVLHHVKSGE